MIVYTYKEPLFCCSIVEECMIAAASPRALILWDLLEGKELFTVEFKEQLSPVGLTCFYKEKDKYLILQTKQGKILVFAVHQSTLTKINQYLIYSLGFTRFPFSLIYIDQNDQIHKRACDHFFTVRYQSIIEKREIITGTLKQEYSTDQPLHQVNFLLLIQAAAEFYYFVAEEGGRIKKFIISKGDNIKSESVLQLSSKDQLKIILWIEAISSNLAYVCLRNSDLIQINLQKMETILTIDIFGARIIKTILTQASNSQSTEFAYCTKSEMGFFSRGKIRIKEKIDKNFILDMDIMSLGLVGVTEEGRIAFLPRI